MTLRLLPALLVGAALGLVYQRLVGCRTGACPLTATPWRAAAYGAVLGLIWAAGR